jgi:hypothetical protein
LTKAITILALTCFLVVGAAVTSILARGSLPDASAEATASAIGPVVANRESKQDKLTVTKLALATEAPTPATEISEPLRQAYAAVSPAEVEAAKAVAALPEVAPALAPVAAPASIAAPAKPKVVSKPQPQKSYALLSDAQIAGIKERLKLSSSQESYWPAVESALRAVARKLNAAHEANPKVTAATAIDPDSEEVQQLKSAAMPLLFQLREDQKDEVRKLARIIGLDKVASAI